MLKPVLCPIKKQNISGEDLQFAHPFPKRTTATRDPQQHDAMPIGKPNIRGRPASNPRPNRHHGLRNRHGFPEQFNLFVRVTAAQARCPDKLLNRLGGAFQDQDITFPDRLPSRGAGQPNMVADQSRNHHIVFLRQRKRLGQRRPDQLAVFSH